MGTISRSTDHNERQDDGSTLEDMPAPDCNLETEKENEDEKDSEKEIERENDPIAKLRKEAKENGQKWSRSLLKLLCKNNHHIAALLSRIFPVRI